MKGEEATGPSEDGAFWMGHKGREGAGHQR